MPRSLENGATLVYLARTSPGSNGIRTVTVTQIQNSLPGASVGELRAPASQSAPGPTQEPAKIADARASMPAPRPASPLSSATATSMADRAVITLS